MAALAFRRTGLKLAVAIREGPATHIWIYEWGSQRFSRISVHERQLDIPGVDTRRKVPGILERCADSRSGHLLGAGGRRRGAASSGGGAGPGFRRPFPQSWRGLSIRCPKEAFWTLPLDWRDPERCEAGRSRAFPTSPPTETPGCSFSPDGRWFAYMGGQVRDARSLRAILPWPGRSMADFSRGRQPGFGPVMAASCSIKASRNLKSCPPATPLLTRDSFSPGGLVCGTTGGWIAST